MIGKDEIIEEFKLRVFEESYDRINICLGLISEDELWKSVNESVPTIGSLVLHLCGNLRQWIVSGLFNGNDIRVREQEFKPLNMVDKSTLQEMMTVLKSDVMDCMNSMKDDDLSKIIEVQSFRVSGFRAIMHVIEHFSYHTGQITTLTKLFTEKETGYYNGHNLN